MYLLDGAIRNYAWGSHQELAALRGESVPTHHPEAELWFGAHPGDPAVLADNSGRTLLDVISDNPHKELGNAISQKFSQQLPFLLKILAAEEPLSLQAHPSLSQAQLGYARENAAGIPLDAPHRNYHDDNHKPELIVALTRFEALAGFRTPTRTLDLLDALAVEAMDPYTEMLRAEPDANGIRALMTTLITLPRKQLATLIDAMEDAARRLVAEDSEWSDVAFSFLKLVAEYGVDAGALCALLLNRITLQPGEAIFMGAGVLHAYLHGVGVEIMANSDNVLRGGLTPKHVDVPELMQVLHFEPLENPVLPATKVLRTNAGNVTDGEGVDCYEYHTPVPEFFLSRCRIQPDVTTTLDVEGPFILMVTKGTVTLTQDGESGYLDVPSGHAAWVGDWEQRPRMSTGEEPASVFVARVPRK
ncbi:MAG: mannose-6-phosphate isomerase, class I [Lawsonella sp.]